MFDENEKMRMLKVELEIESNEYFSILKQVLKA